MVSPVPISERTMRPKAGTKCVSTNFPKAETVRTWGRIFVGSSSRPQTGGQTLTNEASIEGRFRFTGKNLAYDRREFDRMTAWAFNKK
jgi:hypothetical protein